MVKQPLFTRILLVSCALLLIGNIGWIVRDKADSAKTSSDLALQRAYPLLSKRILADNPNDILINFVPLRKTLEARFGQVNAQKSFYFEYLPDGTSVRVGSDNQLVAASLIKVPLTMNLYRAAELGRINLDKTVSVTDSELDNAYGDLWKQGPGTTITLRKAAEMALEQSDNTATHVIFDNIKGLLQPDEESLARLDIDQDMEAGQAVINAKSYSSVLKGLYFSSYLEKKDSQELLGYLTKSAATNRLTQNLPASVLVAHKIGVYNASWAESDCGIVYVPKRPYIVCIMVGLPEDQANAFIADISKTIYDFVSSQ
ncbi:MAG TPA: serine hydrolase [Patescibacteria group bacterium]|nr:serine hydrolase [Patescibacteria group bacterium]